MKKAILKIENLLWITPLILGLVIYLIRGNDTIDIHLHDTYFIIDNPVIWLVFVWLALTALPFLLHVIARSLKKRNQLAFKIHVLATIFLMICISFGMLFTVIGTRNGQTFEQFSATMRLNSSIQGLSIIGMIVFFAVQAAFILYVLLKLLFKRPNDLAYRT